MTELATAPTTRPRAHNFFWTVLTTATAVSITGNATKALLHTTALPAVAAAVAVIPPLALLAAVHGVTVLARAQGRADATHLVAIAMTALIAAGAFWLSYTALRALAVTAGVPTHEAWLWPLIIEGSMAQATVALLTLAHAPARTSALGNAAHADDGALVARPTAQRAHAPSASELSDDTLAEIAARLCARDPARRRAPELVAQVLAHHHLDGWNPTRIGRVLHKNRSTISRILSDANHLISNHPEIEGPRPHELSAADQRVNR
ncbi:DUF2637 domain-containing protein [Nocardia asteroides]|uniref:DUF2637 domain-containing protein n=1 Tax=Nocardia asteroides TaxID=1824 RepID=UPI001E640B78|nr:DUF2637 domain-containing protein [Nocardia asteroides]UGT60351.1 DUF2637 domain-containing protein [Nocardia asteroides]